MPARRLVGIITPPAFGALDSHEGGLQIYYEQLAAWQLSLATAPSLLLFRARGESYARRLPNDATAAAKLRMDLSSERLTSAGRLKVGRLLRDICRQSVPVGIGEK